MKKRKLLIFGGPVALVFLIHFGWLVYHSLTNFNFIQSPSFAGFENYANLFSDFEFYGALGITLLLYAIVAVVVGAVSLILHEAVRKGNKVAYNCCIFVLLSLSIWFLSTSFLRWNLFGSLLRFWSVDHAFLDTLISFVIMTLGITIVSLALPLEKVHKNLRPVLAFSLPIVLIWFLEGGISLVAADTINAIATRNTGLYFRGGVGAAMYVINILIVAIFVAIITLFVWAAQKIFKENAAVESAKK